MPSKEQKTTILFLIGTWAATAAFAVTLLTEFVVQRSWWSIALAASLPGLGILVFWYFGRRTLFFHRVFLTIDGSSKLDLIIDVLRLFGMAGLIIIPFTSHGIKLFSLNHGTLFSLFAAFLLIAYIYPYVRVRTKWDDEYNRRKGMMATAMNSAAVCLQQGEAQAAVAIRNIERNALLAIKSYLEYSVLDLYGNNFNVNLIVKNLSNPNELICIERSDPEKGVPTYYPEGAMKTAMRAFEERNPIYDGQFKSTTVPPKPYKSIWIVPIGYPPGRETECIALLAIDSKKARHLDLADERKALLFNLTPMIALLRYSIVLRRKCNLWE